MYADDKHYRLWDMETNTVALGFYSFPWQTIAENLEDAIRDHPTRLCGCYRVDRMVHRDGQLCWQLGVAIEIP